ncbi:MAG: hypothetical protein HY275_07635 [Gemmatimonadetes bacterium]|nr:hypothetical protein [Gemmatimonadota bacterium]
MRLASFASRRALLLAAVLAGVGCATKSNVVLIGTPVITPNPVPVGTKMTINVGLIDALGCDKATIAVTYNGAAVSTKLVARGAQYADSTTAIASGTISATGTCGSAIQVTNELVTVN